MKLLLTALLLLAYLSSPAQQPELAALLQKANVPGLQLIHTKGKTVTTYSLGRRQRGQPAAVTARTTFQAASLGKVVLAYVSLRLHDQGLLDLDKPLCTYYAYPRLAQEPRAASITARLVLTHATGLPNWAANPLQPGWDTSALRLRYAPDSCFNYSGEGYVLLQKTLEHLTGQSFEALAQREVFQPLRMTNSSFVWQPKFAANAASGHDAKGQPTGIRKFAQPYGAYSLLTTATDYNQFVQALLVGRGLQPATARLLQATASPANRCRLPASAADPAISWAYGVGLAATSHGPALWHWGNNDDFQGFFMTFPDKQESLLFLTNSANGLRLTEEVLRLFVGPGPYWAMQWLDAEK